MNTILLVTNLDIDYEELKEELRSSFYILFWKQTAKSDLKITCPKVLLLFWISMLYSFF